MKKYKSDLFHVFIPTILSTCIMGCSGSMQDGGLRIGWSMEDVTPVGPASLAGQYYERISDYVHTPLKVTALAIESLTEDRLSEQVIMISMDFVAASTELQDALREKIKDQIPEVDTQKVFLNATHTHSAPLPSLETEYGLMVLEKLTRVTIQAWNDRKPAGVSLSMGYSVIGHNRRVQFSDGSTEMYGNTSRDDYIGLEGPTDPAIDMLFFWDLNRKLTGVLMNVSCPSQVTEAKYYVSADYWGELRKELGKKFSDKVYLFPQCGAAGDISPRDLTHRYRAGEANMWDTAGAAEIAARLMNVITEAHSETRDNIQTGTIFKHAVRNIDLPTLQVSETNYKDAIEVVNEIRSREPADPKSPNTAWNRFISDIRENEKNRDYGPWDDKFSDFGQLKEKEGLIEKYENQAKDTQCHVEVHVIRLGDAAIATNPFELYVDYGLQITGRSPANQTFITQLCAGAHGYLPTQRALQGGGYRTLLNRVGPEGGSVLVEETLEMIRELWE